MAKQRTQAFRKQHTEILELVAQMSANLEVRVLTHDASAIRRLLSALAAKLTMHLAMEDNVLYPQILEHPSQDIQKLARAYTKEMGGITASFTQYVARWPSPETIQGKPAEFVKDTLNIFKALMKRIEKEDSELYPLIDREEPKSSK